MNKIIKPSNSFENISKTYCLISKKLEAEIEYALRNLIAHEQQKTQGKKKKKWTKLEASHELGKWLYSQRKSNSDVKIIFEL